MNIDNLKLIHGDGPLYKQLYKQLKYIIENEELNQDTKLPTIREFSNKLEINNVTVINALSGLEKDGLIIKKVGNGTYIKGKTPTYKTNIMDLTGQDSNIDSFPLEDIKKSINFILNSDGVNAFKYENAQGNPQLKIALVEYFKEYNINTTSDHIQIVSGGQQALDIISKSLLLFGETVFTETPTYKGAIESFKSREARILEVSLHSDGMDLDELESKLQIRKPVFIYVMPFNQKPTGISYSLDKKKRLLYLAHKYNFYIIEDDIGSEISLNCENLSTLKSMDTYDSVIYIKSFSPLFMPGLRLGCLIPPKRIYNKLLSTKLTTDISTPGLIQRGFAHYLQNYNWLKYYENLQNKLLKKIELVSSILKKDFIELLDLNYSVSSHSFWFKLHRGDGQVLSDICKEDGLLIVPGVIMGAEYTNYIRISINSIPYENIEDALGILKKSLKLLYNTKSGEINPLF